MVEDQVKRHSSNVNLSPRTDRKPKIEPKSLKRLAAKTEEAQKAVVDEVSNILDVKGVSVSQVTLLWLQAGRCTSPLGQ